ncbi:MAG: 30S ribosomal protein S9 [Candidatus Harrisonbacteria bacterium CG10_big_fil_rev_8_21_14_0_10_40_38]|uniref:30S ribosomal protein S9 n=1 Tax=Candidatus Harrisonbacteria bacterium CG10_big_fil_rev_8_21_14_0_10_40_38 TaxID=1974583 RepID=A0A2H0US67_9BACT|nr:MAG: 30S ribosomal protein S9 [Candidatus Harrisonbacteria bacterium CG10_big_fil_rev_8_21_14_0_10_40_38]
MKSDLEQKDRYIEAKGGRKTAKARVRVFQSGSGITVNEKPFEEYFQSSRNRIVVGSPLDLIDAKSRLSATVHVVGGGINAQADAIRNALAKALVKLDSGFKKQLRQAGFVTRDPRVVERKKYGLKKARRAPQWKKR